MRLRFDHLTVDDGLSHSWVWAVAKDSRGFLWFGTQDGLNRYDGARIRIYRNDPGDPHSLASSRVTALFEDDRGRLWVGAGVLHLYDPEADRFERLPFPNTPTTPEGALIRAITADRHGALWLGADEGVFRFDPVTRAWTHFTHDPGDEGSLNENGVRSLLFDRYDRLWIGTRRGLNRHDERTGRFVRFLDRRAQGTRLGPTNVHAMYGDTDGTIWLGTLGKGLIHFDPATGRVMKEYLPDPRDPHSLGCPRILGLTGDGRGRIYVGTDSAGLNVLDVRSGRFETYVPDTEDATTLASASVWQLRFDDQGILWIGTFNGGVDSVSPFGQMFGLLRSRRGELSAAHVTAVMEDRAGDLWIGTDGGGLNHLDRRTRRVTSHRHDPLDPNTLASDAVLSLLEDRRGNLWVGTWTGGLHRLDRLTGRWLHFRNDPANPSSLADDNVWEILEDAQGRILVGTQGGGVQVLDVRSGRFTRLPGAHLGTINVIAEDRKGNLWIGTPVGAEYLDRSTGQVTRLQHDPNDPGGIGFGAVVAILIDSRGNAWFGTERGGLSVLAPGSRALKRYTTAAGLPADNIADILEDGAGNLWLSTSRGLAEIEGAVGLPDAPRILKYDADHGLQGNEFRRHAACRTRDGEMYFGGQRGLSYFRPEQIRKNAYVPPVVLTGLRIFNQPVAIGAPGSPLTKSITAARELVLSHRHSVVTFEFAALNYVVPRKNSYAYKLEGFDRDWNNVGSQHTATYTNLPSRTYTLRVRAANNDGVWNEQGVSLRVRVTAPFWRTTWFQLLLIAAAGAALALGYRARMRAAEARRRELESLVAERTGALQGIADELKDEVQRRKAAQEDVNRLNEELGRRVETRTAELAEAYRNLSAEKERLAVTLRSIGDGVIASDIDGRVVLMNRVAEELTGWTSAEAVGLQLTQVFNIRNPETGAPVASPVAEVRRQGTILTLPTETLLVARDGHERMVADSAAPIRDRESRIVGVVVVFRDVTERQKVEERLRNAQKLEALGVLAGGLAHDFNNLLTGIFGYIDIARKQIPTNERAGRRLESALSILEKARGLTRQLLTFSRAGQPITAPLALDERLRNSARFVLSGSNVSSELRLPHDLWLCQADAQQIDQVVDNLLLNARQAMPDGGKVIITASNLAATAGSALPLPEGRYVRLEISDQGPGIQRDVLPHIFDPFFTTKKAGTGLGLATVYSIVRKHGGHVDVVSAPGAGTTFTLYLPASAEGSAPVLPVEPHAAAGHGRILVVDDEEYVCDVMTETLGELGYSVHTARSGEVAVALFERARAEGVPFDLLILDLTIPGGLGGTTTLARVRAIDPAVKALASSGYSSDPVMADPRTFGFSGALPKPFSSAELSAAVASALARPVP